MIIIISGATHSGKTLLAQRLMEKIKIPYICQDHLKMGLIRTGNTDLSVEDDEKLTDYLWPITREIIKTAIENSQNLIVEGCYVPFEWKQDFEEEYLNSIQYLCLSLSEEYIENHYDDIISHASCIEKRLDDSSLTEEYLKKENSIYINGCHDNDLKIIEIKEDYNKEINEAVNRLINFADREYRIIKLSQHQEMKEKAALWFSEKWRIDYEVYKESIEESFSKIVPSWYLCLDEDRIIAGMGVIENDFHDRKDLTPNICAVYTEADYRNQGICGRLLDYVCLDMAENGIDTLYLLTDHNGFYERYGWEFYCLAQTDGEEGLSRMYIHRYPKKSVD